MSHRRSVPLVLGLILAVALLTTILLLRSGPTTTGATAGASPASNQQIADSIVVRTRRVGDLDRVAEYLRAHGYVVQERLDDPPALGARLPSGVTIGAAARDLVGRVGIL